jgi:hypothetical protein
MPTGLKNSPAMGPLVSQQPRRAINHTLLLTLGADNVPQNFPGLVVAPGLGVALRGATKAGVNVGVVRVSLYPDELLAGGGRVITPDTEISFPVDHMAQIWAIGKAADGLIGSISGVPIA